jgi:hypothetical protein
LHERASLSFGAAASDLDENFPLTQDSAVMPLLRTGFAIGLIGFSACSVPFRTSSEERKVPCDRLAAQAIESTSLEEAEELATRAAECYASAR